MILRELIANLSRVTISGSTDQEVLSISASSKHIQAGQLFVAIRGTTIDGHTFIEDALRAGATIIMAEKAPPSDLPQTITWLHVPNSRYALAIMASAFYAKPWTELKLAGVTGTNGKTTTTYLIHHIMEKEWHRAGLLGTILIDDGESKHAANHTTPGSLELVDVLQRMKDHACRGAAMEVSSHGIDQDRVAGIGFNACVFTNLTQDHLDYHGTMERYFDAKKSWFLAQAENDFGKKPVAVINLDDNYGAVLHDELKEKMRTLSYGFGVHCDFRANNFKQNVRGLEFELTALGKFYLVRSPLIGRFNVYNLLAALAASYACGIKLRDSIASLLDAPQVPGRIQYIGQAGGTSVFVDYAHTPDALENVCKTLKELKPKRLITVFGCGGDRDKAKRPLMGAAVAEYSDVSIITSDNPRSEDPASIIQDIQAGFGRKAHLSILDRAVAIDTAVQSAKSGDIVLIAGKGHETYQEIAGVRHDFDDRKHASKALRTRGETISKQR